MSDNNGSDEKDKKKSLNISLGEVQGKVVNKTQGDDNKGDDTSKKNEHECCGSCSSESKKSGSKKTKVVDFPKEVGEETEIFIQVGDKKVSLEDIDSKDLTNWIANALHLSDEARSDLADIKLDTYKDKRSLFNKTVRKCEQQHKIQLKMVNKNRTGFPIV